PPLPHLHSFPTRRSSDLAGRQQILEPHIGERAAHHHLVIAAARAIRVEVLGLDAVLHQVLPGRVLCLLGDSITTDHISPAGSIRDRKSTRLNSSHLVISY